MGGIELLIKILSDPDPDLELLAAETMANLAKFRNARTVVRKHGGIPKLIDLLDVDLSKVIKATFKISAIQDTFKVYKKVC
jgi:hypothetical protein